MEIIIRCTTSEEANDLKVKIVEDVKNGELLTWEHTCDDANRDIIFHNPAQYVSDPSKNVIFNVTTDGSSVCFKSGYWVGNNLPTRQMYSLHTGRLVEALLSQTYAGQIQISA